MPISAFELDHRFRTHKVGDGEHQAMETVRDIAHHLAMTMWRLAPDSRELSLAITNLEQAVFWANAAIARKENP